MHPKPELLDNDNPEWTAADFAQAVSFSALPESLQTKLSTLAQKPAILTATVQFDREVLERFKATGADWQVRMNDVLKQWLKEHAA